MSVMINKELYAGLRGPSIPRAREKLQARRETAISGERSLTGPPLPTQRWACPYLDRSRLQRYLPWNISALLKISNNRPNPLYLGELSY